MVQSRGTNRPPLAAVDDNLKAVRRAARAAADGQRGNGSDRGQGLAAKAERRNGEQVAVRQLGRGVTLDAQREIAPVHADAVVRHPDERQAAARSHHFDRAGTGIDGVLDQFLHHARGTLDDFARGDAVDGLRAQLADGQAQSSRANQQGTTSAPE